MPELVCAPSGVRKFTFRVTDGLFSSMACSMVSSRCGWMPWSIPRFIRPRTAEEAEINRRDNIPAVRLPELMVKLASVSARRRFRNSSLSARGTFSMYPSERIPRSSCRTDSVAMYRSHSLRSTLSLAANNARRLYIWSTQRSIRRSMPFWARATIRSKRSWSSAMLFSRRRRNTKSGRRQGDQQNQISDPHSPQVRP